MFVIWVLLSILSFFLKALQFPWGIDLSDVDYSLHRRVVLNDYLNQKIQFLLLHSPGQWEWGRLRDTWPKPNTIYHSQLGLWVLSALGKGEMISRAFTTISRVSWSLQSSWQLCTHFRWQQIHFQWWHTIKHVVAYNNKNLLPQGSGGQKSKIKVPVVLSSLWDPLRLLPDGRVIPRWPLPCRCITTIVFIITWCSPYTYLFPYLSMSTFPLFIKTLSYWMSPS